MSQFAACHHFPFRIFLKLGSSKFIAVVIYGIPDFFRAKSERTHLFGTNWFVSVYGSYFTIVTLGCTVRSIPIYGDCIHIWYSIYREAEIVFDASKASSPNCVCEESKYRESFVKYVAIARGVGLLFCLLKKGV